MHFSSNLMPSTLELGEKGTITSDFGSSSGTQRHKAVGLNVNGQMLVIWGFF
jgi:hypothetical protein